MPTPIATVDIADLSTHYYGILYEPPSITRSIGSGNAITGQVEVNDIEFEMFPFESSGALGSLLRTWLQDGFQDHIVKMEFREPLSGLLTAEWVGVIQEDALLSHGGIRLRGAGFPYAALEQRIPKAVITLEDFPGAIDVGKTPPYIIGVVKKLKLLYIDDRGPYDYLLMLGRGSATPPSMYRDTVNQGATLPSGTQSFEAIPPGTYTYTADLTAPVSGYKYVRIRFTTRQVNANGSLVGIYADFEGDSVSRNSPVEAIRSVLGQSEATLLGGVVDGPTFDAARDKFANLVAPRSVAVDGVIGLHNQPVAVTDLLKPLLQVCGGYLGITQAGAFTIAIDGPPDTVKLIVGAGPQIPENNISEPGTRSRLGLAERPRRFILNYGADGPTGAHLYQRVKTIGTKGRDIVSNNIFLARHSAADIVADRLAKIQQNAQDVIEGTVLATPEAWALTQGDLILYTWQNHGCEDELRKVIRVKKELERVTIDHRRYHPNEWSYQPTGVLPPDFQNPENSAPIPPDTPPPPGGTLVEDTGEDRIVCAEITVAGYVTIKTIYITIDGAGRTLKKWAFVEVCTVGTEFGGLAGTTKARLRNVTTGAYVEVTKSMVPRIDLFSPYTVYFASFPVTELFHNETVGAGAQTIVLELSTSPTQSLFYGSADMLQPGLTSSGYLRAQEWA